MSTASLGDHSYIVVVGNQAVAVDIQRDLERFEEVLNSTEATLAAVFETHIHNDYVSGGKRLAEAYEAVYVLPANTGAPYEHTPISDGDTIAVSGWEMRAMHAPGHTYHHMSYVLESQDEPVAIFSGGSMLVGAVGRSDLLGPDHTEALLRGQYASMHRIAGELPDPSVVAPTHGSGSFCSASEVADATSTVGEEKLRNPALISDSAEVFAMSQVMGYGPYPAYYKHMAPSNLEPMRAPSVDPLPVITSAAEVADVSLIDVRPFPEFAAGHVPGSLSFEMSNDDAVYMGWTMEWGSPIALIGSAADTHEVRVHLQRIGWDDVVGRIDPVALGEIAQDGLETTEVTTFGRLGEALLGPVLDVRDPIEKLAGVIPGADLAHVTEVAADPTRFAAGESVIVYCASGYRSGIAASFIEAAGGTAVVVRDDLSNYKGPLVVPAV